MEHEMHDHDRGLEFDLSTLFARRRVLGLFGAAGLSMVAGCSTTPHSKATTGTKIPEETAGPFPGDGSNGPNVLTQSGIVRSDIRSSFGSSTTVAKGVALTVTLSIVDLARSGAPYTGAAVYVWPLR